MNDPDGTIFFEGRYHLFYQYNPEAAAPADACWGHAASEDLVHWKDLPVALAPTARSPDQNGVWSGCAVLNRGVPTIVYTGLDRVTLPRVRGDQRLTQCVATSEDMVVWKKYENNPVLADPPQELGPLTAWHDPHVWREQDGWYMLLGCGFRDGPGAVLLYRSSDLLTWDYMHPFCKGKKSGEKWLVPDFFRLGERDILMTCVGNVSGIPIDTGAVLSTKYMVGDYRNHRFTPEHCNWFDWGPNFSAARTLLDDKGRRILWGWITEGRSDDAYRKAGWAGVMSLPRVLEMGQGGVLQIKAAEQLQASGSPDWECAGAKLRSGSPILMKDDLGDCLEIRVDVDPKEADEFVFAFRRSSGGEEETFIRYRKSERTLSLDRTKSSLSGDVDLTMQSAPLELSQGERLDLHIYLDCSVVEIFACDRVCLTGRIYPTRRDSHEIRVLACGGESVLNRLRIWRKEPI